MADQSERESKKRVLVIGAGLTGLATAFRILERNTTGRFEVTIVESSHRVGGKINTVRQDGLILEGGADGFVANKPHATKLCRDLGLGNHLIETIPKNRRVYVRRHGRLNLMPQGLVLGVPTMLGPLLRSRLFSLRGIARMGLDLFLPRGTDSDESMASFIERRLGSEALARIAEPLLGGIYVGDPRKLSIRATFPQLASLEDAHRSLVWGTLKTRKPPKKGPPPSAFFSLKNGMSELPETLAAKVRELGGSLRLDAPVETIARDESTYRVTVRPKDGEPETLVADHVVVAVPASVASSLVASVEPQAADLLAGIDYVSSATAIFAYPRSAVEHLLDASGALIPRDEGPRVLAISFMTSKWPGRAPEETVILRVFFGGYGREEDVFVDDANMLSTARNDLRRILGVNGEPTFSRCFRYIKGNPQPVVGHLDRMRKVRVAMAKHRGLHLGGTIYDGVGIPDCARQAEEMAGEILR